MRQLNPRKLSIREINRRINARKSVSAAAVAALVLAAAWPLSDAAAASRAPCAPHEQRGTLLSVTEVADLSPAQVEAAIDPFFGATGKVRYAVTGYRITYATIDPEARPTTASGLVVLPAGAAGMLHVISYEHGTNPTRDAVASVTAGDGDREAAELFASAGFAAVAPDYLGLGTGPGTHPYMHLASEVSASTDMLDASRHLAARHGVTLDPRVLVTGFSQGAPASLALARAIQDGQAGGYWRLGALAPISGPYEVRTAEMPALLRGELDPYSAVLYISFWTVSMNRLYHLYDDPTQVFQRPYAAIVQSLFDGSRSEQEILAALPSAPAALLTAPYAAALQHPTGALARAMRQNDTSCDFRSHAPVRLYGAGGDRGVVFANSRQCQAALAANGTTAALIDVGDVDHNTSAELSVPLALQFLTDHAR